MEIAPRKARKIIRAKSQPLLRTKRGITWLGCMKTFFKSITPLKALKYSVKREKMAHLAIPVANRPAPWRKRRVLASLKRPTDLVMSWIVRSSRELSAGSSLKGRQCLIWRGPFWYM